MPLSVFVPSVIDSGTEPYPGLFKITVVEIMFVEDIQHFGKHVPCLMGVVEPDVGKPIGRVGCELVLVGEIVELAFAVVIRHVPRSGQVAINAVL